MTPTHPPSHPPNRYYLYCHKNYSIRQLSMRFGVKQDRVSVIINMKRTEPQYKAMGCYDRRADDLLTEMYSDLREDPFLVPHSLQQSRSLSLCSSLTPRSWLWRGLWTAVRHGHLADNRGGGGAQEGGAAAA